MKQLIKRKRTGFTMAMLGLLTYGLLLAGCGGGGGAEGVSSQTVSGVAATGAPLAGQVTIKNAAGTEKATVIGSDGSFALDITDMKGPYLLQATGSVNGVINTLYSFASGPGIANINPLSNAAVSQAAGVKDPTQIFASPDPTVFQKIEANLPGTVTGLMTNLKPLLAQYGADGVDPIKGMYIADHTGLDGMFDNVPMTIANGVITAASARTLSQAGGNTTARILAATAPDGAALYATYCASCHRTLASSQVRNASASRITSEISSVSQMRSLSSLTSDQITAIAAALAGTATTTPPPPTDGVALYTTYCASCHRTLASSRVRNASASRITSEISSVSQMRSLSSLTSTQIAAIAAALAGTTTPPSTVPAAPAGVIATGGTRQATISWPAVTGAASYNIYWSATAGVTKTNGAKLTGVASPVVRTGLVDSTTYYFIVTAVNSLGEGAASVQVAATTLTSIPATTAPAAPTGVSAVGGAQQATISWSAVTGAASYNIYWSTTAGVTITNGTRQAGVTSPYIQTGLSVGTYNYVVTAVNSVGESAASTQVSATTTAAISAGGDILYTTYCASCHRALASSDVRNTSASRITSEISGVSQMRSLSSLTSAQIAAIAAALSGTATTTTPPPTDGPSLYALYCGGCHSALASSTKLGRTAPQITSAIGVSSNNMTSLSSLTSTQIAAIAGALSGTTTTTTPPPTTPPPTDGPSLYALYCASCHGALASSTKPNRTAPQITSAIGVSSNNMTSLSSLTSTQITAIATALVVTTTTPPPAIPPPTTPPPTTGSALYATYCAGCHGSLASSGKQGRSAAQITAAIGVSSNNMSSLSSLTSAQIADIATALAVITPPPPPPPAGSTISYATYIQPILNANCLVCHGPGNFTGFNYYDWAGTVSTVIPGAANGSLLYRSLMGGMGATQMPIQPLPQLLAAQIQLIVDWINQGALNN